MAEERIIFDKKKDFENTFKIDFATTKNIKIHGLIINFDINLTQVLDNLEFSESTFNGSVEFRRSIMQKFSIKNCTFNSTFDCIQNTLPQIESNFNLVKFNSTVNFRESRFRGNVYFTACEFKESPLLWGSTFTKSVDFSFSKFESNLVLGSASVEDTLTLKGVRFAKGLDISTTKFEKLKIFDLKIDDFKICKDINAVGELEPPKLYANTINPRAKRETFRILKKTALGEADRIGALTYSALERKAYLDELRTIKPQKLAAKLSKWGNIFILGVGYISNLNGRSWFTGIIFTLVIGLLFFYLSLINTDTFCFSFEKISWDGFSKSVGYYIEFMNPTHKSGLLVEEGSNNWVVLWDFFGKIFVALGIYQTIVAFRKYSKL